MIWCYKYITPRNKSLIYPEKKTLDSQRLMNSSAHLQWRNTFLSVKVVLKQDQDLFIFFQIN